MSRFFDLVTGSGRASPDFTPRPRLDEASTKPAATILLNSNESPYGPSPKAVEAMQAALAGSHRYPDNDCAELRAQLALHHAVQPEQIVVTPGATALLGLIARSVLQPGLNAVVGACSFIAYGEAARAAGGEVVEVPLHYDRLDLEAMLSAINDNTRVVFLANPNNPTGTIVGIEELTRFVTHAPQHVIVVLDEAYYDYAQHFAKLRNIAYSRSHEYLREDRHLVIVRSFSKAHGLAGIRVGYGIGPTRLMEHFRQLQEVYAVSGAALAAATAALSDTPHTTQAVENNARQIEWLSEEIARLELRTAPAWGNFIYCDVGEDAEVFANRLREEGIVVRPLGPWGAATAIRITAGTVDENHALIDAIRKLRA